MHNLAHQNPIHKDKKIDSGYNFIRARDSFQDDFVLGATVMSGRGSIRAGSTS